MSFFRGVRILTLSGFFAKEVGGFDGPAPGDDERARLRGRKGGIVRHRTCVEVDFLSLQELGECQKIRFHTALSRSYMTGNPGTNPCRQVLSASDRLNVWNELLAYNITIS